MLALRLPAHKIVSQFETLPTLLYCCRWFVRSLESRDSKSSDVEFLIESNLVRFSCFLVRQKADWAVLRRVESSWQCIMYHVNAQDTTTRRRKDEDRNRVLTTRREALSLYREIVRITALFDWPNEQGVPWYVHECLVWVWLLSISDRNICIDLEYRRDVLRESARKEFEEARYETDPEVVSLCFWCLPRICFNLICPIWSHGISENNYQSTLFSFVDQQAARCG